MDHSKISNPPSGSQSADVRYRWRLLRAGPLWLDGGSMFGVVPRVLWSKLTPPDTQGRIELSHNCLLLERLDTPSAGQPGRILIETGSGDKFDAKNRAIFGLSERSIADAVAEAGFTCAQIAHVIVSHLHFDHAGGLTRRCRDGETPDWPRSMAERPSPQPSPGAPGEGETRKTESAAAPAPAAEAPSPVASPGVPGAGKMRQIASAAAPAANSPAPVASPAPASDRSPAEAGVKLTFPNARITVQRREWEDAIANSSVMTRTYLKENLHPLHDRLNLIDAPPPFPAGHHPGRSDLPPTALADRQVEVLPGVRVFLIPGHTWGQQAILFHDDRGRTVVFSADLMPTVNHVGAAYNMAYDVESYTSTVSRGWFLKAAAEGGWLLALDHEAFEPLQRVRADGKGWYKLEAERGG